MVRDHDPFVHGQRLGYGGAQHFSHARVDEHFVTPQHDVVSIPDKWVVRGGRRGGVGGRMGSKKEV